MGQIKAKKCTRCNRLVAGGQSRYLAVNSRLWT